jgi:hypothetical protein
VELVFVAPEVVELGKRVVDVLPSAARHGAKGGDGLAQAVFFESVKAVNPEAVQLPMPVRLAGPSAGAVNADRLDPVAAGLMTAGDVIREFGC